MLTERMKGEKTIDTPRRQAQKRNRWSEVIRMRGVAGRDEDAKRTGFETRTAARGLPFGGRSEEQT